MLHIKHNIIIYYFVKSISFKNIILHFIIIEFIALVLDILTKNL
jgi:hypothetical protein